MKDKNRLGGWQPTSSQRKLIGQEMYKLKPSRYGTLDDWPDYRDVQNQAFTLMWQAEVIATAKGIKLDRCWHTSKMKLRDKRQGVRTEGLFDIGDYYTNEFYKINEEANKEHPHDADAAARLAHDMAMNTASAAFRDAWTAATSAVVRYDRFGDEHSDPTVESVENELFEESTFLDLILEKITPEQQAMASILVNFPDITLREMQSTLDAEHGIRMSLGTVHTNKEKINAAAQGWLPQRLKDQYTRAV
jgi:hypothetical protein